MFLQAILFSRITFVLIPTFIRSQSYGYKFEAWALAGTMVWVVGIVLFFLMPIRLSYLLVVLPMWIWCRNLPGRLKTGTHVEVNSSWLENETGLSGWIEKGMRWQARYSFWRCGRAETIGFRHFHLLYQGGWCRTMSKPWEEKEKQKTDELRKSI